MRLMPFCYNLKWFRDCVIIQHAAAGLPADIQCINLGQSWAVNSLVIIINVPWGHTLLAGSSDVDKPGWSIESGLWSP